MSATSAVGGSSCEPGPVDTVRIQQTSNDVGGIGAALSAARLAVAYDAENNLPAAFRAYNTAVGLLEEEIRLRGHGDTTKLKKILEAYSDRISLLRTIVPLEHQFCFDDESIFSPERDLGFSNIGTKGTNVSEAVVTTPISTTPISEGSSPSWTTSEVASHSGTERSVSGGSPIAASVATISGTTTRSKFSATAPLLGAGPSRSTSLSAARNFSNGSSAIETPASPKKGKMEGDKFGSKWSFVDILREEPLDAPPETPPPFGPHRNFWLARALARSMTSGGYVTKKLYVPRLLWRQPGGARLLALDTKISTCEAVAVACEAARAACGLNGAGYDTQIDSLQNPRRVSMQETDAVRQFVLPTMSSTAQHFKPPRDLTAALRELDALADAMDVAQVTLARKLAFVPEPGESTNHRDTDRHGSTGGGNESFRGFLVRSGSNSSIGKAKGVDEESVEDKENGEKDVREKEKEGNRSSVGKASGLRGWGGRFSKSVERMHASVSRDRVDDASSYIDALVRLFQAAQFLDDWLYHVENDAQGTQPFASLSSLTSPGNIAFRIYVRLKQSGEFMGIVGAFVLSDLNVLMKKYLKRRRVWISE